MCRCVWSERMCVCSQQCYRCVFEFQFFSWWQVVHFTAATYERRERVFPHDYLSPVLSLLTGWVGLLPGGWLHQIFNTSETHSLTIIHNCLLFKILVHSSMLILTVFCCSTLTPPEPAPRDLFSALPWMYVHCELLVFWLITFSKEPKPIPKVYVCIWGFSSHLHTWRIWYEHTFR